MLLADDSRAVRTLTRGVLEAQGFDVVAEAGNGAEAVALAKAHHPDVLLLDVAMPVMDGFDALQELRRIDLQLPVVMHSGFSDDSLGTRCLDAGAVAYTEKGRDLAGLGRVLRDAAAGVGPKPRPPAPRAAPAPDRRDAERPPRPRPGRGVLSTVPQPWVITLAAVLFAVIFALRMTVFVDDDATALGVLYCIPVALLAGRFGLRGGLAGFGVATALLASLVLVGVADFGLAGFLTRAVTFGTIGVMVGVSTDRVQELLAFEKRASAAIVSTNEQLVEALAQSQSSIDALQAANDDLRQFGYIVSHDLAEPLRSMSGFSSLLESDYADKLDDRGMEYLGFIRDGAVRMRALIDDLRAYTDAGQQQLVPEPIDLGAVLEDVVRSLSASIEDRSAVVEGADLPVVLGDRSLLTLVLQNLVGNGIKFNESERPQVCVTAVPAGQGFVAIDVADNGIGIPEAHFDRVFGLFSRLHTREQYPGTGVGLAIVRRVVQRHGGRIVIVPSTTGTTFRITLPATPNP